MKNYNLPRRSVGGAGRKKDLKRPNWGEQIGKQVVAQIPGSKFLACNNTWKWNNTNII